MNLYKDIFLTMLNMIHSDGGDGCGTIVAMYSDYKEVSKAFEEFYDNYLSSLGITGRSWNPIEYEDRILWTDMSNENLTITSKKEIAIEALQHPFGGEYIIVCY